MCLDVVLHAGIRTNHNESHSMLRRGGPTEDLHLLDSSAIRPKTAQILCSPVSDLPRAH